MICLLSLKRRESVEGVVGIYTWEDVTNKKLETLGIIKEKKKLRALAAHDLALHAMPAIPWEIVPIGVWN